MQWNCNGLLAHLAEIQQLIANKQPDFICLQETRLKTNNSVKINGYNINRKDRITANTASGGTAILTKNSMPYEEIKIQTTLEAIAIKTYLPDPITICSIYIPPASNIDDTDIEDIKKQLPGPVIFTGDLNAHNILWGSQYNNRLGEIIERTLDNLILLNPDGVTHFCSRTGGFSNIDLTFCSPRLYTNLTHETLLYSYIHGHSPTITTYQHHTGHHNNQPTNEKKKWNLENANWTQYRENISQTITNITIEKDIENTIKKLTTTIINAAEEHIGYKNVRKNKNTPWWNQECETTKKEANRSLYRYKRHPTIDNLIEVKKTRAKARRTIREAKKKSWQEYVGQLNKDTPINNIWKAINRIKGNNRSSHIPLLKEGSNTIIDHKNISNCLANTFETISSDSNYSPQFLEIKKETEKNPIEIAPDNNNPINLKFTIEELNTAINKIKRNSAPGPDNIPFEFIHQAPQTLKIKLLEIYNYIWFNNNYPNSWNITELIPIHKPDKDKTTPSSYRPISLANTMGKLMEKMVNFRLTWYLEKNNILNSVQCGFRQNRSTSDHLTNLTNEIQLAFHEKQHLIAVFFDLEKAYDTTWRRNILNKLQEYEIQGPILQFITNFVNNRKFRVRANNHLSDIKTQQNGIPQGATLSVTLFLVAINDITTTIQKPVKVSLFADDLAIYARGRTTDITANILQKSIDNLQTWTQQNGFKFSKNKTEAIIFSKNTKNIHKPKLTIDDQTIDYKQQKKFLGVTFDERLTWRTHITELIKDCQKRINIMKTTGHHEWGADKNTLLTIYKTIIRSKIDYGSIFYNTASKNILTKIDRIQNLALRIATGAFRTSPVISIHNEAGETTLADRRATLLTKYAVKIANNPAHPAFSAFFTIKNINNTITPLNQTPLQKTSYPLITNPKIPLHRLEKHTQNNLPPWTIKTINTNLKLLEYSKNASKDQLQEEFQKLIREFPRNTKLIYTDASKKKNSVKTGFEINNRLRSYHLHTAISITNAEIEGIHQAIKYIFQTYERTNYIICTDSLGAIKEITNTNTKRKYIQQIQHMLHNATKNNTHTITLLWIPAHRGIPGNENIHTLIQNTTAIKSLNMDIPVEDIQKTITLQTQTRQQTKWLATNNNKLRTVKEDIKIWNLNCDRKTQTTLTRLRIGHTKLTHEHLLQRDNAKICDECHVILTVEHLLTECRLYTNSRNKHNIQNSLKDILQNTTTANTALTNFLKDTQLYRQI